MIKDAIINVSHPAHLFFPALFIELHCDRSRDQHCHTFELLLTRLAL
jgi:hypothetical protein